MVLVMSTSFAYSQNPNFENDDGKVIWRYVYENDADVVELRNNYELEFKTDSTGSIIKTNFGNKKIYPIEADFKVETKDGRYRITVFNIVNYPDVIELTSGMFSGETSNVNTIEKMVLKRDGSIKNKIWGMPYTDVLHEHFEKTFEIKNKKENDW